MGSAILPTAELLHGCIDLRQQIAACRPSDQAVAGQPYGPCLWLSQPGAFQLADCRPNAGGQGCHCQVVSRLHVRKSCGQTTENQPVRIFSTHEPLHSIAVSVWQCSTPDCNQCLDTASLICSLQPRQGSWLCQLYKTQLRLVLLLLRQLDIS